MVKYKAGDIIRTNCVRCHEEFDRPYPGMGRPHGHYCPKCSQVIGRKRRTKKVGTTISATCNRCGKVFEYLYSGTGPLKKNCPDHSARYQVGDLVEIKCIDCGEIFVVQASTGLPLRCDSCKKAIQTKRTVAVHRRKRGGIERGSLVHAICKHCQKPFDYYLHSKRQTVCIRCKKDRHNIQKIKRVKDKKSSFTFEDWLKTRLAFQDRCAYCGSTTDGNLVQDHFIPFSQQGQTKLGNIVPACRSCNSKKSRKQPEDFIGKARTDEIQQILKRLGSGQQSEQTSLDLML